VSLITIVSVVKDDSAGLHHTLNSFGSFPSEDFKILILDGSSDRDAIADTARGFSHLDIRYEWRPPIGVYGAMNDALQLVKTPYVYYLNAGDELADPDVPRRLAEALRTSPSIWAYGQVLFFSESGHALTERSWSYSSERRRLFARGVFPAHQGVVVRTEALIQQGGFDRKFRIAADYSSILKLSRLAEPLELGFPLARFRRGGISTTEWKQSLWEFHQARISVFAPSGWPALRERLDTVSLFTRTYAYRGLQVVMKRRST
jgi:glycosyltransferase involved in cell wall biosynthesis